MLFRSIATSQRRRSATTVRSDSPRKTVSVSSQPWDGKASGVHNLTLAELNKARNESNLQNTNSVSTNSGVPGLFYLRGLNKYGYTSSSSPYYWLASPYPTNSRFVRYMNNDGYIYNFGLTTVGVRPVVSLTSEVKFKETPEKIEQDGFSYNKWIIE